MRLALREREVVPLGPVMVSGRHVEGLSAVVREERFGEGYLLQIINSPRANDLLYCDPDTGEVFELDEVAGGMIPALRDLLDARAALAPEHDAAEVERHLSAAIKKLEHLVTRWRRNPHLRPHSRNNLFVAKARELTSAATLVEARSA